MKLQTAALLASALLSGAALAADKAKEQSCGAGACGKKSASSPHKGTAEAACGKKDAACAKSDKMKDAACAKKTDAMTPKMDKMDKMDKAKPAMADKEAACAKK